MATASEAALKRWSEQEYRWGFTTDIDADSGPPGLNEDIIRRISAKKGDSHNVVLEMAATFDYPTSPPYHPRGPDQPASDALLFHDQNGRRFARAPRPRIYGLLRCECGV